MQVPPKPFTKAENSSTGFGVKTPPPWGTAPRPPPSPQGDFATPPPGGELRSPRTKKDLGRSDPLCEAQRQDGTCPSRAGYCFGLVFRAAGASLLLGRRRQLAGSVNRNMGGPPPDSDPWVGGAGPSCLCASQRGSLRPKSFFVLGLLDPPSSAL